MESPKLIVILLIVFGAMWIPAQGASIERRNLLNLGYDVECADPRVGFERYLDYGCFCGWGGNGNQPVDEIDRCCQHHDHCYNEADRMGCDPKLTLYTASCENGIPKCSNNWLTDLKCGKKVCDCDVTLSLCLKKYSNTYNKKFEFYNQKLCKTVTTPARKTVKMTL